MGGLSEELTLNRGLKVGKNKSGQGKTFQAEQRSSVDALRWASLGVLQRLEGESEKSTHQPEEEEPV